MLAKRLNQIMQILKKDGITTVAELARMCSVTEKTIRLDLDKLDSLGMITRVHGGALISNSYSEIYPMLARKQKNMSEKQMIAKAALELIEDGDTIFLDAGSTNLELAKLIQKNLIVVTNDADIAAELLNHPRVTMYCTGGLLQRNDTSNIFVGPDAVRMIERYRTQKCFMGCSAINRQNGMMVFSSIEAEIKSEIVRASNKVICLADNSKFGKIAFTSFAPIDRVNVCITDKGTMQSEIDGFLKNGIEIVIA